MQIKAIEIRNGTRLEIDGDVYIVVGFLHITPGKGRAVVRTKLKHVATGRVIDRTFTSSEKLERAELDLRTMQFLYKDMDNYVFMDMDNYEQIMLSPDLLGEAANFLKENFEISVAMHKGKPIGVELPVKVDLKVVKTAPGVRGDTVTAATKPATLETGLVVQVPLFINEGDVVRIDTRDGKYEERV